MALNLHRQQQQMPNQSSNSLGLLRLGTMQQLESLEKIVGQGRQTIEKPVRIQLGTRRLVQVQIAEQFTKGPLLVPFEAMMFKAQTRIGLGRCSHHKGITPE